VTSATPTRYRKTPEAKLLCWQAMRCLREFSVARLVNLVELPHRTVYDYVKELLNAGYLEQTGTYDPQGERGNANSYRLVRDTGLYPPAFRKGQVVDANLDPQQRDKASALWQAIRELRMVDRVQLAAVTGQDAGRIGRYLKFLADQDYLVVRQRNLNGCPGSWTVYQLVGDPGPLPPLRRRDGSLLDLNQSTKRIKEQAREQRKRMA